MDIYGLKSNDSYEEYAIVIDDGVESEIIFGTFRSIDYAREALADMKTYDRYKDKKLYIVKHVVSKWQPY